MSGSIDLLLERVDGKIRLLSPEVGLFTECAAQGAALAAGETAGTILSLGRTFELRVPEGVAGVVVSAPPDRVRAAVGYGDVLYELAAEAASAQRTQPVEAKKTGALVLGSPQSGRFYHRPAPSDPPFVAVGATIEDGQPIGMIEVMKTFSHVPYRATGGLPKRARVARMLAADGADVKPGEPLLEVEPA